jgi:hypothetical protein
VELAVGKIDDTPRTDRAVVAADVEEACEKVAPGDVHRAREGVCGIGQDQIGAAIAFGELKTSADHAMDGEVMVERCARVAAGGDGAIRIENQIELDGVTEGAGAGKWSCRSDVSAKGDGLTQV